MAICRACQVQNHGECEDVFRQKAFRTWKKGYGKRKAVGKKEKEIIRANKPYDSCTCQHRLTTTDGPRVAEDGDVVTSQPG